MVERVSRGGGAVLVVRGRRVRLLTRASTSRGRLSRWCAAGRPSSSGAGGCGVEQLPDLAAACVRLGVVRDATAGVQRDLLRGRDRGGRRDQSRRVGRHLDFVRSSYLRRAWLPLNSRRSRRPLARICIERAARIPSSDCFSRRRSTCQDRSGSLAEREPTPRVALFHFAQTSDARREAATKLRSEAFALSRRSMPTGICASNEKRIEGVRLNGRDRSALSPDWTSAREPDPRSKS
jgi:hypothetical protein